MKLIQENPNEITINNKTYDWNTSGVIVFAIDPSITQCFIDFRTIHANLVAQQKRKGLISQEDIDNGNWNRRTAFEGRIWERPRVISFWRQPNPEQLDKIISLLEKTDRFIAKLRIRETFKIEISEGNFVLVKDYLSQDKHQENDFDQSIAHITPGMTTKNKEAYKQDVYQNRDKKLGNMSAAEYNALRRPYSEQTIHESPNQFDIYNTPHQPTDGHYTWSDKNSISFIIDKDITKSYMLTDGKPHMDILDYQIYNGDYIDDDEDNEWERKNAFHGRIWTTPKVISFWKQPNASQLNRIINLLKQSHPEVMSNIDIINDYVIETSYDKQNQKSTFVPVKDYIKGQNTEQEVSNNFDQSIVHKIPGLTTKDMENYKHNVYQNRDKKLGNMSNAEYNFYKKYGMGENEKHLDENMINDVESNDINLKSFKPKSELNPKFWINNKLNSRVRLRLLDIADDFINELAIDWIKPKDIVFTGSLANYNWSKYSDIDVHILIDYDSIYKKHDFVEDYFKMKKDIWSDEHPNLKIYGFPVELYVEDINNEGVSSGVYSLEKNKWIVEPGNIQDSKLNEKYIKKIAAKFMTAIDNIGDRLKKETDSHKIDVCRNQLQKIFDKIKNLRKDGLKNSGEMSSGNIIFKILRRTNYFDKLWDLMNTSYDRLNSIKENKKRTIVITEEQSKILKEAFYKNSMTDKNVWFDGEPDRPAEYGGKWEKVEPLIGWICVGKAKDMYNEGFILIDPEAPHNMNNFNDFIEKYVSLNKFEDGSDGFNRMKLDSRYAQYEIYDKYKGSYYDMLFNGINDNYREEKMKQYLSKCFIDGNLIIGHHDSNIKITNGVVAPMGYKNHYSKPTDWGAYFWLGIKSGGDNSNGGRYTYYCKIPINEIYFNDSSKLSINSTKKEDILKEYSYIAGDWKQGNTVACQTYKSTPIWCIRALENGKINWYDKNWNIIEEPQILKEKGL